MTGTRLNARDLRIINIGTHYLSSTKRCADLFNYLISSKIPSNKDKLNALLQQQCDNMEEVHSLPSILIPNKYNIEKAFSFSTVEEIFSFLETNNTEWNSKTLKTLKKQCPTILKVVLRLLRTTADLSSGECLKIEFRVGLRLQDREDLQEGVASVLIRKDFKPIWKPDTIQKVDDSWIMSCFEENTDNLELHNPPVPRL